MKFRIDHDYHIHSHISSCSSDPEQNNERILQYAKKNGLERLCLTDHYWDSAVPGASEWYKPQNFEHISAALPLPQGEGIGFYFGCETDFDKHMTVGLPKERYDDFKFIIVPTTHLHMTGFTISEEEALSDVKRAELWVKRLDALLSKDLPFKKVGIAHPACSLIKHTHRSDFLAILDSISNDDMERLFSKASALGCGIELNKSDMSFADSEKDTVLRMFRIAKSCGCKFYLGSDAHKPAGFSNIKEIFGRAIDLLGLTEADKYHFN